MDCTKAREALYRWLDGEPAGVEDEAIDAHLDACPECARALAAANATRDWFAGRPRPAAPADLAARVLARLRSREGRLLSLLPLLRTAAAAAVLLLVATGAAIVFTPAPSEASRAAVLADGDAVDRFLSEVAAEHAPAVLSEEDR